MDLSDYPKAIALQSEKVNQLEYKLSSLRQWLAQLEGQAELSVAIDPDLKNDNQRKCKRFSLLQSDPKYTTAIEDLNGMLRDKADNLTQLEYLLNSFSVEKLRLRGAIAQSLAAQELA